ncbi:NAD(P)H-dependent FMN reductase [Alsobacter metallidurans]|uniref:NAD(P)H-dependent FMN reductase n=1 Tax=Alsobacter metallidurans TaxID=340221 RepID=A0A917MG77_9HYPH|nr:NADPH-dependent FMN reductase [Alsobacter metallidurans]GGH09311.1 NAD(P)H-dependent FMN reductase [Alsobacter metallidurans]
MTVTVLGISGSLRKASYNSMALRAAQELAPDGMTIETAASIGDLPHYNDDVRQEGYPPAVQALRDAVKRADGVLIVTPEYNYSVPGVLKNAIDWVSRPPEQPFDGKPIAFMSASPGIFGGARAQYQMRQMFVYLNGRVLNRPEVMIGACASKFDEAGKLTDAPTRDFVRKLLEALQAEIGQSG